MNLKQLARKMKNFNIGDKMSKELLKNKNWDYYLFDADGTLVDTRDLIFECFTYSLKDRDLLHPLTRENLDFMIGIPYRKQLEFYLGPLSEEKYHEIRNEHIKHQEGIYLDYISLFPGVIETLEFLKSKNKKLAIVTSRSRATLFPFFKELGIYKYFDLYVTPQETEKHKPDPEPVLKTLELLAAEKKASVFIGDAVFDIESGARAGVETIFVNWSPVDLNLSKFSPDFRIDDMRDLIF